MKRIVDQHNGFTIFTCVLNSSQIYLTAAVTDVKADPVLLYEEIYCRMLDIILQEKAGIIQERILGSIKFYKDIICKRADLLKMKGCDTDLPFTFIEGNPCWGEGLSGIQMSAISFSEADEKVWTIYDNKLPCGRGWKKNGATYLMLQNMYGIPSDSGKDNREEQTASMFDRTQNILKDYSGSYKNVIRTWIYLDHILEWYKEFNLVRNAKYKEFGFIPKQSDEVETEQIFLPASTGILASNPQNAAAVMDVLAVIPGPGASVKIKQTSGVKQRSPFVYGSAFSRAMNIHEPESTTILLSGTASIDEQGRSVFENDTHGQIVKTMEVVDALIGEGAEGTSAKDICTATVFLKKAEDYLTYKNTLVECGLTDMPAVCIVADVCRDELLFEIDAIIAF
jgi:enamine deaminase RidA (YjgF/YER057c/UK114 family)